MLSREATQPGTTKEFENEGGVRRSGSGAASRSPNETGFSPCGFWWVGNSDEAASGEHCLLPYSHINDMFFHMKTTLNIDDKVMLQLKREAARQRRTMSELVEIALRSLFQASKKEVRLTPLPAFRSGGAQVDVANRDALYQIMEGR